jgi:hypothetical protein
MLSALRLLGMLAFVLAAAACSIRGLDEPRADLSETERASVAAQVDRAVADERWKEAWNQGVDGGLDRSSLEDVALAALAAKESQGEDMVARLVEEYGALSVEAQAKADAVAEAHEKAGAWKWAARVLVATDADAPAYPKAWLLYDRAPPKKAPDVLEVILEARTEKEKE